MARPISDIGRLVRQAIEDAKGGVVTWRSIAQALHEARHINRDSAGELMLVKRQVEWLARTDYLLPDGHIAGGKGRPLMGYRTASSMQHIAQAHGTQIPARRAQQQREAVEQLLLAFGAR